MPPTVLADLTKMTRLEEAIAAVGERLGMRLTSHEVILRGVQGRSTTSDD